LENHYRSICPTIPIIPLNTNSIPLDSIYSYACSELNWTDAM